MNVLAEQGWVAPAEPGPSRRFAIAVAAGGVLLGLLWALLVLDVADGALGSSRASTLEVEVRADGSLRVPGVKWNGDVRMLAEGSTAFALARAPLPDLEGETKLTFRLDPSLEPSDVAVRIVAPHADVSLRRTEGGQPRAQVATRGSSKGTLHVTTPQDTSTKDLRPLRGATRSIDSRVAEIADDRAALGRLRGNWPWLVALGAVLSIAVPLLLWWRARRSFFSMRLPGPGTSATTGPPSSLDPVGAAILVAGAEGVDVTRAFAGHVLDLVERRQLQLRRVSGGDHPAGSLLGLAHAEEMTADDAAVTALRSVSLADQITVELPDARTRRVAMPETARDGWRDHVAARARFERVVEQAATTRVAAATAAVGVLGAVALVDALLADLDGRRASAFLVAVLMIPAASILAAWLRDARGWRRVERSRRLERAQWLAWRDAVTKAGAGGLDLRSLPLVVATGPVTGIVRDAASPIAVGLQAVTGSTVGALRSMVQPAD